MKSFQQMKSTIQSLKTENNKLNNDFKGLNDLITDKDKLILKMNEENKSLLAQIETLKAGKQSSVNNQKNALIIKNLKAE